ncbi:MAG: hypothetical protein M3254_09190 [Actinomycetota bacterium]|nr:hypothetical protein [Actinomycetota bacterium]
MDALRKIAEAVLYEGYILWPYRRSTTKNQQRWTFGGVYPRAYSESRGEDDPWLMQTQCLVSGDTESVIQVRVRFLHVTERNVGRKSGETLEFVEELQLGEDLYLPWDEATEREIVVGRLRLSELLETPVRAGIDIPGGSNQEELVGPRGEVEGALVRSWRAVCGAVEVEAEALRERIFRLTVRITNTTPWENEDRESTLRQTFCSTHTTFEVVGGEFVSMTDPPQELRELAQECENFKTWPVLVGEEGGRTLLLSSPIILSDYPQIAPESPGDLFDGGEIDQLLILNILTLTDEEKAEMRASDPRAREILERCESLSQEELMNLHGAIREFRVLRD